MTPSPGQHYCANHPHVPTQRACGACGRPFCESCLTELRGRSLCGWCRDLQLSRFQTSPAVNPATVVTCARVFDGVVLVAGIGMSVLFGGTFSLPFFFPSGGTTTQPATGEIGVALGIVGVAAILSLVLFLPPLLMLGPGRPWLWVWQIVATVLAMIGGCALLSSCGMVFLLGGIPLLIFWVRPEVRAYCEGSG